MDQVTSLSVSLPLCPSIHARLAMTQSFCFRFFVLSLARFPLLIGRSTLQTLHRWCRTSQEAAATGAAQRQQAWPPAEPTRAAQRSRAG